MVDRQALRAGGGEDRQRLGGSTVVPHPGRLEVRDLDPDAETAADLDGFLDRRDQVVVLVADVARVQAVDRGQARPTATISSVFANAPGG